MAFRTKPYCAHITGKRSWCHKDGLYWDEVTADLACAEHATEFHVDKHRKQAPQFRKQVLLPEEVDFPNNRG